MAIRIRKMNKNSTNDRHLNLKRIAIYSSLKVLWLVSPSMAVRLVKAHIFKPVEYRTSKSERQFLETGTHFQLDLHGEKVHGWVWGQGPGVLFVHGWNGRGIQLHRFFKPLLRSGMSVITFDAPGHGDSEGKTSSYFQYTDTVRALLNPQNGFNIQGVVGYSLGSAAVINALNKENSTVPAVLIAPALRLQKILFNTFDLYGIPEVIVRKAIAGYEERYGYILDQDDPYKLLSAVNSDVLIIHDRQDREIPFQDSKEIAGKWPHIDLSETVGLGHRRILADMGAVAVTTEYIITQICSSNPSLFESGSDPKAEYPVEKTATMRLSTQNQLLGGYHAKA